MIRATATQTDVEHAEAIQARRMLAERFGVSKAIRRWIKRHPEPIQDQLRGRFYARALWKERIRRETKQKSSEVEP